MIWPWPLARNNDIIMTCVYDIGIMAKEPKFEQEKIWASIKLWKHTNIHDLIKRETYV